MGTRAWPTLGGDVYYVGLLLCRADKKSHQDNILAIRGNDFVGTQSAVQLLPQNVPTAIQIVVVVHDYKIIESFSRYQLKKFVVVGTKVILSVLNPAIGVDEDIKYCGSIIAEAEYNVAALAMNKAPCIQKLLADLYMEQKKSTEILVDNEAAISIENNLVFHGKNKHLRIKFYFLREVQRMET
ncbi:hypothetical protein CQW23_23352 [Capsicum baccatum]|uniref:Uncharacterized protein n=1 Tax=Capsicum baccatum TaxID=33114 RepID=A0A2G2VRR3_CAPBA|nr:hypothetical protein CQW23_23352 [Capsicum baccatum]